MRNDLGRIWGKASYASARVRIGTVSAVSAYSRKYASMDMTHAVPLPKPFVAHCSSLSLESASEGCSTIPKSWVYTIFSDAWYFSVRILTEVLRACYRVYGAHF